MDRIDDYEPRQFQDSLNDDDEEIDLILVEENEDMTETLHVDAAERREHMEDNENPDLEQSEDTREELEDQDQET